MCHSASFSWPLHVCVCVLSLHSKGCDSIFVKTLFAVFIYTLTMCTLSVHSEWKCRGSTGRPRHRRHGSGWFITFYFQGFFSQFKMCWQWSGGFFLLNTLCSCLLCVPYRIVIYKSFLSSQHCGKLQMHSLHGHVEDSKQAFTLGSSFVSHLFSKVSSHKEMSGWSWLQWSSGQEGWIFAVLDGDLASFWSLHLHLVI